MSRFNRQRQNTESPVRGVTTIRKGLRFLQKADYDNALREFRSVVASRHPKMLRLVRSAANGYAFHTERLRRESKKLTIGNARVMNLVPGNRGDAWSDVDIAMVLVAPNTPFTTYFLASFLGRTVEGIRFQRRYSFDAPLSSWAGEKGTRYTRFTQNRRVAQRLGLV